MSRPRPLLFLPLLTLAACPQPALPPVERAYAPPSATALLDALADRARKITSLRAESRVEYQEGKDRVKLPMDLLVARGGKLRLELKAPIGGSTLATLTADGTRFQLLDTRNNRFLEGPAKACNVARLIRLELDPDDVVAALLGGAPLIAGAQPASDAVRWDPQRGGREVLTLRLPDGGIEVLELDGRDRRWDLLSAERKDASGRVLWRVTHAEFSDIDGVRLPRYTTVAEPPHKADAHLKLKSQEPNVPPPAGVFSLPPPASIPVEPADC